MQLGNNLPEVERKWRALILKKYLASLLIEAYTLI